MTAIGEREGEAVTTQVERSRTWDRWVVSAPFRGEWTLVGVFARPADAFAAAAQAARRLAAPPGPGEVRQGTMP